MKIHAGERFSLFFLNDWNISPNDELEVEYVDAKQFLRCERIDLVCKLLYIKYRENGRNMDFVKKLYSEHIKAFSLGTYTEPGNENKNTIEKYFETFDALIDEIKQNGFDPEKSIVPVGENNSILDGSHRTAIAIYFNLRLPIARIPNYSKKYDYLYFKDRGMTDESLDYIILQYIAMSGRCYVACIWPRAKGRSNRIKAEGLIKESTRTVYKKEIRLNYNGIRQLMIHVYGQQEWAGTIANGFSGIPVKARACYGNGEFTTVYVLEGPQLDNMIQLKANIRDIFNIENHSIHITDTNEEALEAAQILLNKHSTELMNYGDITTPRELASFISDSGKTQENGVISSEMTKVLFGVKRVSACSETSFICAKEEKNCDPLRYGYVYGVRFPCLEDCNLSFVEKRKYNLNQLKYGAVADIVTSINIKRRIRHLGGIILRKLKVIR